MWHFIYKTTRIHDGSFYVGMHSTEDLNDGYLGSGILISASVKKHGSKNHIREILEMHPSREALEAREIEVITDALLRNPKCMNLVSGEQGGFRHTPETKSKISSALLGKKQSDDTRKKKSIARAGKSVKGLKGLNWFNDGTRDAKFRECPDGWMKGRLKRDTVEARLKKGLAVKNTMWVNDGAVCKRLSYCPDGFVKGRIK